jgi:hypothetical protein
MQSESPTSNSRDRLAILQVVGDWVFFRDSGDWDALRALFARDGRMTTNSTSGSADEFVAYGRVLRSNGLLSHHFPGPSLVRLHADKAVVQTVATLMVRASVHGVEVDIWVLLRYLDRLVREDDCWKIADRHPMYIKDRMDPVVPGRAIEIDHQLLAECPEGCRYLIYVARANGVPASPIIPTVLDTPAAAALIEAAEAWLAA